VGGVRGRIRGRGRGRGSSLLQGQRLSTYVAIARSVDALMMVLWAAVQTISGPLVGAVVYTACRSSWCASPTMRASSAVVIVLVLAFRKASPGFAARLLGGARGRDGMTVLSVRDLQKSFGGRAGGSPA